MRDQRTPGWLGAVFAVLTVAGCTDDQDDLTGDDDHSDHGNDDDGHDDHDDGHDDHDDDHDDGHDHDHNAESEVFTRVELTFTPDGGGEPIVAAFSDPDGDGGMSGSSDPIAVAANTTYALTVTFGNELEDPPVDVTEEIREEAEEHQVFFSGDVIGGLFDHAYADRESDYADNALGEDLPVGLANRMTTAAPGTGSLTVQLQHLPDLNGEVVKVPGLEDVYPDVPGWPDVVVNFEVTVQ
ncbi:MAG: hypothetical protein AAF721_14330 [Myxococcota bacterium]